MFGLLWLAGLVCSENDAVVAVAVAAVVAVALLWQLMNGQKR